MKLLCVGNSFSEDACVYMSKIATAGGLDLTTVNLFIGGCSLKRHCSNIGVFDEEHRYTKTTNGDPISECDISLDMALAEDEYDYVSVQQASPHSGDWESYVPYLEMLVEHIKKYQPKAKIVLHETWAYEYNSTKGPFEKYGRDRHVMHARLSECYRKAEKLIGADLFIPCGDLIAALREHEEFDPERGGTPLTRDGAHMGLDYGRYAIAALWCVKLGMKNLEANTFVPDTEGIDSQKIALIKSTICELFTENK